MQITFRILLPGVRAEFENRAGGEKSFIRQSAPDWIKPVLAIMRPHPENLDYLFIFKNFINQTMLPVNPS